MKNRLQDSIYQNIDIKPRKELEVRNVELPPLSQREEKPYTLTQQPMRDPRYPFKSMYPKTTLQNVNATLDELGVAVIPNILTDSECDFVVDKQWRWLSDIWMHDSDRILKDDPSTWRNYKKLAPHHGGLLQHWGVAQTTQCWFVRAHPRVREVFESIWHTSDLLSSFDGCFWGFPPELMGGYGKYEGQNADGSWSHWMHTDSKSSDVRCIQGGVNILESGVYDGCLSVLSGSHKLHHEYFEHYPSNARRDFIPIINTYANTDNIGFFLDRGCEWWTIYAPRGSIVLWDSRTFHMGMQPRMSVDRPPNFRCVVYACMTPRKQASWRTLEDRKRGFVKGVTASHWPHKYVPFPTIPGRLSQNPPALKEIKPVSIYSFKNVDPQAIQALL